MEEGQDWWCQVVVVVVTGGSGSGDRVGWVRVGVSATVCETIARLGRGRGKTTKGPSS